MANSLQPFMIILADPKITLLEYLELLSLYFLNDTSPLLRADVIET
ncbi:MAG: hypothetical protein KUG79_14245 [Pseudomonadales bacterium]|nr:hypothetical protein [Pseudomonadales bacterium]